MSSFLNKIKSKYTLQNLFNFIPYNLTLKLIYGTRQLSSNLNISIKSYQKFNEIKKILKQSYDINKYYSYLDIKHDNNNNNLNFYNSNDIEKILYGCLNSASFNTNLFIGNKGWEYIIKNVKKNKLIITPKLLNYLFFELNNQEKQNIFNLLKIYKNNIVEIDFCYFINDFKANFDNINKIINILENIFKNKGENENNEFDKINKIIFNDQRNNNHNIKKIIFEKFEIVQYIDITTKFFDKINNIISLEIIEGLSIDSNYFNEYQFSDFLKYLSKKMISLKFLKINDFGYHKSHYADLSILCSNLNDQIEIIDFSSSFCLSSVLTIFKLKKHCLKGLKLKILSNNNNENWDFLLKYKNSLETFELEIKENKSENLDKLLSKLNLIDKLKNMKIIAGLKINQLIYFKNIEKIENFNIDLDLKNNLINYSTLSYFSKFLKLKTLKIGIINTLSSKDIKIPKFYLPAKLNSLSLNNIEGNYILSLLNDNNNNLIDIEELKIENTEFSIEDYNSLINLFNSFKSLKKLSLNKIDIDSNNKDQFSILNFKVVNFDEFYEQIPLIFKNIPSLIELDISNNGYKERLFKSQIFENIRLAIPKKLLSFKIFNSDIPISQKVFDFLTESFGLILDIDNNYPNIKKKKDYTELLFEDHYSDSSNSMIKSEYISDENDIMSQNDEDYIYLSDNSDIYDF